MNATAPRRLLIADDDPDIRWTLREVFEPVGFEVMLAETGEETLRVLDHDPRFDCLLIDFHLPGITGLETIQLASQQPPTPISILLTAHPTQEVLRKALDLKVFTVLSKPVAKKVVTHTVERALQHRSRAS
jgi:CheY-like chemotaxis protein